MEPISIIISVLGSTAVYGIIKLMRTFYRNNDYNCKSSCMVAHTSPKSRTATLPPDEDEEEEAETPRNEKTLAIATSQTN